MAARPNIGDLLTAQAGRVLGVELGGPFRGSPAQRAGGLDASPGGPARAPQPLAAQPPMRPVGALPLPGIEDSDEDVVDLKSIIRDRPKAKVVRAFMRENLAAIKGEDEEIFG